MYLKIIILSIASTLIIGCGSGFDVPIKQTVTFDNGFSQCTETSGFTSEYCEESRAYDAQIDNNSNDDRFDPDAYTLNSTSSLEGHWMILPKPDSYSGEFRQSCDLNEQTTNNFDLTCIHESVVDFGDGGMEGMIFNPSENKLDISTNTESGDGAREHTGETYDLTDTVWGVVSGLNRIEIYAHTVWEWSVSPDEEFDFHLATLIRLGDTATSLGQITIEKFDFDDQSQLANVYDVHDILEKNDVITLNDINGDILAEFKNDIIINNPSNATFSNRIYGNYYVEDLFPGVDPYLFDGIDTQLTWEEDSPLHLRLRQFDYVQNDANGLDIDWLINRLQATRFERGDTIGNISLSF
ncbi:MAG: hypothetical protein GY804_00170 [Alphaproteobacteria bacterium]|nr:hypothetical protein [Alphaproteobacteria bacterium]